MKIGQINGLNMKDSKEIIDSLNEIEGIKCNYYIKESLIEFKSIFTEIAISLGAGVVSGIVANKIYNFLNKKKEENKKISISIGNINIYQGDTITIVEEKINRIKNLDKNEKTD
jgi:hypothetical protein